MSVTQIIMAMVANMSNSLEALINAKRLPLMHNSSPRLVFRALPAPFIRDQLSEEPDPCASARRPFLYMPSDHSWLTGDNLFGTVERLKLLPPGT